MRRSFARRNARRIFVQVVACIGIASPAAAQNSTAGRTLSLREAFDEALLQNRQLQIVRIDEAVAENSLSLAYAYYDPIFSARLHKESATDTGGFDPANFSADAIYEADSEVASMGLIGFLPSGLSYTVNGNYAHSYGTRNFLNFDSYKVGTSITVEQPLLRNSWIDLPRWQIKVNKQNLKVSELGVTFIAMTVVNLAQQAYYDLALAWETLQIQNQLQSTKQEFLTNIQRQIQLGAITALEEKLAQSQLAATRTDLILASNAVALASNNLRTIMGTPGEQWTGDFLVTSDKLLTVPEVFDRNQSWRNGLRLRPDLLQLAVNLETADITMRFHKNQLFPTLNLFGSYGLKGSDAVQAFPPVDPEASSSLALRQIEDQTGPNSAIGVFFSVPLTSRAERANFRNSKELKERALVLLKQKEELILREIADAMDVASFSYQRAEAAREAVEFAAESLRAEESKLRTGGGSIYLVLDAQTELANARLREATVRRDYNRALSQLYFTEGTLLDRIQLDVRFQ